MDAKLGMVAYEPQQQAFLPGIPDLKGERGYSEETAREIDCAVRELVHNAFETATGILKRGRSVLESGVRTLMETETLDEAQLVKLGWELAVASGAIVTLPQERAPVSAG